MRRALLFCLIGLVLPLAKCSAADPRPVQVGNSRQLFLDDRLVASSTGLERTWHEPTKAADPVMTKAHPWEGLGPYVYGTVLRDQASGQFKLWYNSYVGGRPDYFTCYATSQDGLHWERPACDAVQDPRLPPGNNAVLLGSGLPDYRQCVSPSVMFRPDEPDPARRYAMVYWDTNAGSVVKFFGLCLAFSPDGIHWTNYTGNPVFEGASDVVDAQYDPIGKRYLLHYKIWRVDGEVVASKLPRGTARNVSYWPIWDPEKLTGEEVRYQGRMIDFSLDDTSPIIGSVDFAREPTYRRVVARAESKDLIHWTNARLVADLPQAGDPPGLTTYGMSTFSYEGRFLGLLRVFHDGHEIDLELMASDDDLTWKRTTPRKPFIPLGAKGSFDAGMVVSANAPVVVGDELWFYYGAFKGHHEVAEADQACAIGLARLRRDGFASLAAGATAGELVTVPLQSEGSRLVINAAATAGELAVEIRNADGKPQAGFAFADCDKFQGDAVSHTVTWRGKRELEQFRGKPIQLAFRLKNARIFAFQWEARQ